MRRTMTILLAVGALALLLADCARTVSSVEPPAAEDVVAEEVASEAPPPVEAAAVPASTDRFDIKTTEAGVRYIVDPDKIRGGGPPKDGIPAIDDPKYVSVADADRWIADNELVLTISYRGVVRVYPLQIMVWHEIVNDVIAGDPILITY